MTGGNGSKIQPTSRVWFVINDCSGGSGGQPQTARKKKESRLGAGAPRSNSSRGAVFDGWPAETRFSRKKRGKKKRASYTKVPKGPFVSLSNDRPTSPPPFFIHDLRLNVFLCPNHKKKRCPNKPGSTLLFGWVVWMMCF